MLLGQVNSTLSWEPHVPWQCLGSCHACLPSHHSMESCIFLVYWCLCFDSEDTDGCKACLVLQGTKMNSHQLLGASHSVGWDQQPWVPIVTSPSMPSVSRWWHRRGEEIVSLSPLWPLGHKQAAPRRALQCAEVQPDLLPCSSVLHMSPPELGQEATITVSLGPS